MLKLMCEVTTDGYSIRLTESVSDGVPKIQMEQKWERVPFGARCTSVFQSEEYEQFAEDDLINQIEDFEWELYEMSKTLSDYDWEEEE